MAEAGKKVEVRFGAFTCVIEGYEDPVEPLGRILAQMQRMINATPALAAVEADLGSTPIDTALRTPDGADPGILIVRNPGTGGRGEAQGSLIDADAESVGADRGAAPGLNVFAEPEVFRAQLAARRPAVDVPAPTTVPHDDAPDTAARAAEPAPSDDKPVAPPVDAHAPTAPEDRTPPPVTDAGDTTDAKAPGDGATGSAPVEPPDDSAPEAPAPAPPSPPTDARPVLSAADLARQLGSRTTLDMLECAAAWLGMQPDRTSFTRREVMDVFEALPGAHPRALESRIRAFGEMVRSGTITLVSSGQFALSDPARARLLPPAP